jgi:DNA-binding FadR family transcriptional regulator
VSVEHRRVRVPKVAEIVAGELRRRILSGELTEGAALSNQTDLLAEFGVSRASMREALRILETEGLITIRRGNRGGAVVHTPGTQISAYTLALSLESNGVTIEDVGQALRDLEASCAASCARRPDRAVAVVATLRTINDSTEAALDDFARYVEVASEFHEAVVALCGNATLAMVAGAVESLWLTHVRNWATTVDHTPAQPTLDYRRNGLDVHRRIVELIDDGDSSGVAALVRDHVEPRQFQLGEALARERVRASIVRP